MVLLYRSTCRVEQPAPCLSLELQVVLEVGALHGLVFEKVVVVEHTALVVVPESEECEKFRRERVVRLVIQLIAIGSRIIIRKKERGPPGSRIAIGPANRGNVAEVLSERPEAEVERD